MPRGLRGVFLLAALTLASPAFAQPAAPVTVRTAGGEVTIVADRLEDLGPDNLLIATGNVEITRGNVRLQADRVEINRATGDATAQGRVSLTDGEDRLTGERIEYNLRTGTGVIHEGEARAAPYYRVAGRRMERLGDGLYHVRDGIFTTCESTPPDWSFRAGSTTADLNDLVHGTDASFWVRDIPLVPWVPFFAAPIRRERQTGFLPPRFGNSSRKGIFFEIPFYWAISDSQDATVALDVYTKRGVGATGEYRYVLSERQQGSINGSFVQESQLDGDFRGLGQIRHDWLIAPGFSFKADVNGVTDDQVLSDYGDQLAQRASQRVESNVFLTKDTAAWSAVATAFWYQDLTTERPVELQRLPYLRLMGMPQPLPGLPGRLGILYDAEASFVNFVRIEGSEGTRFDLHPRLARPVPLGPVTLTPFLGGRVTAYSTGVTGTRVARGGITVETTDGDWRLRRLFEVGGELEARASRVYQAGGRYGLDALLHSVEPRVNYTFIAGEDLSRLPLWQESIDRIPRTSRFEYSLINRVRARTVAPPGTEAVRWEALRLSLTHSYDLEESEQPLGNIIADLILQPTRFLYMRGDLSYNVYGEGLQTASADLNLVLPRFRAAVGNRYSTPGVENVRDVVGLPSTSEIRGTINFLQGSFAADISKYLAARYVTNWDLREDVFVENRVAVDLRFQCWTFTVEYVARHDNEDELRFAVSLLGVGGSVGTSVGVGTLGGTSGGGTP
jgi:LPS-assembly protein